MTQMLLNTDPEIYTVDDVLTSEECRHFINIAKPHLQRALVSDNSQGVVSNGRTGSNCWIRHASDSITLEVAKKIAKIVGMPLENAESFQVIYYGPGQEYRPHYDSWEHNGSEKTLRCMRLGGARLRTALVYLNDPEEGGGTKMHRLGLTVEPQQGRLLVFNNTYTDSHVRHPLSEHAGLPVIKGEKYAFNLWFKECRSNQLYRVFNPKYYESEVTAIQTAPVADTTSNTNTNACSACACSTQTETSRDIVANTNTSVNANEIDRNENYYETFAYLMASYNKGNALNSYRSLTLSHKVPIETFIETVQSLCRVFRDNHMTLLNRENLERQFIFNELTPVVVTNVLTPKALTIVQDYYRQNIAGSIFSLGDRQSQRYKAHNESLSRLLHYAMLPLIEHLVGHQLQPTYTYLSAYVRGADLPPHTDRADCQFTVSFIVERPDNCSWPIYVHKPAEPVKHKGRYLTKPLLEACHAVDTESGGLMMFCGTDHIHFREPLEGEFYNIVLLHYCTV